MKRPPIPVSDPRPGTGGLKDRMRHVLASRAVFPLFYPFVAGRGVVFTLHRFADAASGVEGHDPEFVSMALALLRREGFELLGLEEMISRLTPGGRGVERAVAFTIDDGYREQATVAAPLFAAAGCPVTIFVTTGFLDRQVWFWWDRVEYAFLHTTRNRLSIAVDGVTRAYSWDSPARRRMVQLEVTEELKLVPDAAKQSAIEAIAVALDVALPHDAPPGYEPMTWAELRAAEAAGATFAPHSVTHPVLSRVSDLQAEQEITESWRRINEEAARPAPIFCYPHGNSGDYGERELAILDRTTIKAGVTMRPGYLASVGSDHGRFRIPRLAFPADVPDLIQYVSGIDRFKHILRSALRYRG